MISCGWLSPDCKLHECSYSDHLLCSHNLVKQYGIQTRKGYQDDDTLLASGWFKITRLLFFGNGGISVCFPRPFDDDTTTRWKLFLKGCITEKHRAFFRKAYFDDPSDFELSTIIDFLDYGIISKDEVINLDGIPDFLLR